MIKINKNDFLLEDAYEDIDDPSTVYLCFSNNNGISFTEVTEIKGELEDFINNNEISPSREYLLEKSDFSESQWETLSYCYNFWLTSSNGLNCFIEPDVYEDDGFKKEDFISLFDRLNEFDKSKFPETDQIEFEDGNQNGAINIYPVFIQLFNIDEINSQSKMENNEEKQLLEKIIDWFEDHEQAKEDLLIYLGNNGLNKVIEKYFENHPIETKKGLIELLEFLKNHDYKMAVASSSNLEVIKKYLKKVGVFDYFDVIIGGDIVTKGKPDPEIYSKCMEQLNLSKEECIGVEDTANGVLSIHRAGMKPIMIPDLEKPSEEIENLVYAKLESLGDVIPLLKEMN